MKNTIEHVVHSDGRETLRAVAKMGVKEIVVEVDNGPPGTGRVTRLKKALEEAVAQEELRQLKAVQERAEKLLNAHVMSATTAPPAFAEFIISFLAPENLVQPFLGDMEEMFQENVDRIGERRARRKYWLQCLSSLAPLAWQWLKRIGFITFLIDYFRSKFGF